jgi:hypothetical protein
MSFSDVASNPRSAKIRSAASRMAARLRAAFLVLTVPLAAMA